MNFLSHYCRHFTGAFKFKNRQGRTFFWLCLLADVFLVSVLLALNPFGLLGRLLILLALLVIAGNAIQRLKDAGITPWVLLLWFIPFVGQAILAILLLLPGRKPVDLQAAAPSSPYVGGK
ncbi:DUF805 domain-containing protein [Pseudomonas aeruginosa]|uniref:DUF805 domain-containing protein n=1 Tax=Pseudomonas aeruginosa TaxID=287 RepID=UPI000FF7052D|nr:DUF805 domain-containing protein [Pseudomonas aeruginosa]ELV1376516.1 DUF805 domain-containing protein [Pseudomonas aeruginosa]MDY1536489.1 DUF805 domain-containing protein [Pseudomonas aeruginosa]RQH28000.1 DUF805 domain-containing protein [Pseudomonas aeruginosa]